jgi:enoyl-CoA hydratase/carnithine racemase
MSKSSLSLYIREPGVARLVIDRAEKRNAFSLAMWKAIPDLIAQVVDDDTIKALIIQGATSEVFAAGADIAEFEPLIGSRQGALEYMQAIVNAEQSIGRCGKPTIAMIRGICMGGGLEIAMACDLRFASQNARFGIPPAKLGIAYSLSSTYRLQSLIGAARAKDLLFSARQFDVAEAAQVGLVQRVWPDEEIEGRTLAYANDLAQNSLYSIYTAKKIFQAIADGERQECGEVLELRVGSFFSPDLREGLLAYREKRHAKFSWNVSALRSADSR